MTIEQTTITHDELVAAIIASGAVSLEGGKSPQSEEDLKQAPAYKKAFAELFHQSNAAQFESEQVLFNALHAETLRRIAFSVEENATVNAWVITADGIKDKDRDGTEREGGRILMPNGSVWFVEGGVPGGKPGAPVCYGPCTVSKNLASGPQATTFKGHKDSGIIANETHDDAWPQFIPSAENLLTHAGKGVWRVDTRDNTMRMRANAFGNIAAPFIGTVADKADVSYNRFEDKVKVQAWIGPGAKIQVKRDASEVQRIFGIPPGAPDSAYGEQLVGKRFLGAGEFGVSHPRDPANFGEGTAFDEFIAQLQAEGLLRPYNDEGLLALNLNDATPLMDADGNTHRRHFVQSGNNVVHRLVQKKDRNTGEVKWDISVGIRGDEEATLAPALAPGVQANVVANPWVSFYVGQDRNGAPTNAGAFFVWEAAVRGIELDTAVPDAGSVPSWAADLIGGGAKTETHTNSTIGA